MWEDGAEHQDSQSPELPTESTSRGPVWGEGVQQRAAEGRAALSPRQKHSSVFTGIRKAFIATNPWQRLCGSHLAPGSEWSAPPAQGHVGTGTGAPTCPGSHGHRDRSLYARALSAWPKEEEAFVLEAGSPIHSLQIS